MPTDWTRNDERSTAWNALTEPAEFADLCTFAAEITIVAARAATRTPTRRWLR